LTAFAFGSGCALLAALLLGWVARGGSSSSEAGGP
jgi:hypothetical protein